MRSTSSCRVSSRALPSPISASAVLDIVLPPTTTTTTTTSTTTTTTTTTTTESTATYVEALSPDPPLVFENVVYQDSAYKEEEQEKRDPRIKEQTIYDYVNEGKREGEGGG